MPALIGLFASANTPGWFDTNRMSGACGTFCRDFPRFPASPCAPAGGEADLKAMLAATIRSRRHRIAISLGVVGSALAWLAWAPDAHGVVCANDDPMPLPDNGYIGWWNGSSAVAIGPNWIISAKHVGGSVGGSFWMRNVQYRAVEIIQHATQDIQLIRVAETLPGYHRLATGASVGDVALLGGYGATAGNPVAHGYDWTGAHEETWGANIITAAGSLLVIRFDNPSGPDAVPHESIFAVNDSGAGLFTVAGDGSLELAGVAVSVSSWGQSTYGSYAYSVNMAALRTWILPIADPGTPITSSSVAPRASLFGGGVLPAAWAGAVAFGAVVGRRRRGCRAAA